MAREQAEHFWPLKPKAEATTPSTAASRSASAQTRIESLPPISRIVRLIQIWPGRSFGGALVNLQSYRLGAGEGDEAGFGMLDDGVAELAPEPGQKLTTPGGSPASSRTSMNLAAMVGASLEGFRITVLPVTMEAAVMPAMMAKGKFQGGMTAPTPSGM